MKLKHLLIASAAAACVSSAAPAADFSDPTWPCVQRKVERLSIGLMWPTPLEEGFVLRSDAKAAATELAQLLALRRTAVEELEPAVQAFGQAHDGDPAVLGRVFEMVFKRLSTRRTQIINGIGKLSLSQAALAGQIDQMRTDMDAEMAAAEPDFDKVDSLEEKLDWDQLIYTDRQQSIVYLCETPVLLEKRLYAVAKLLQSATRDKR